jgi:hypothetical protein
MQKRLIEESVKELRQMSFWLSFETNGNVKIMFHVKNSSWRLKKKSETGFINVR